MSERCIHSGPAEGTRSAGICSAGVGRASCDGTLVFPRTLRPQGPAGCANAEPHANAAPWGHQLPPPGMRPRGSRPVTPKGLSHACSPRNPATSCVGEPKTAPDSVRPRSPPPRSAPRGRFAGAPRSHFAGGENRSPGRVCSSVPRPAAGSGRALSQGSGEGGAAPAACPAGSPRHYLPSLPPSKKTFHKLPRDGGKSERPRASGACPDRNTQVPGLGRRSPRHAPGLGTDPR